MRYKYLYFAYGVVVQWKHDLEAAMTNQKRKDEVDWEADRVLRWASRLPHSEIVVAVVVLLAVLGLVYLVNFF